MSPKSPPRFSSFTRDVSGVTEAPVFAIDNGRNDGVI